MNLSPPHHELGISARVGLTVLTSVLIGSAGLSMRSAEVDGRVLFDATEVSLLVEMMKLMMSLGWIVVDPPDLDKDQSDLAKGTVVWWRFAPSAVGFCLVNNFRYELVRRVNPGLLSVLWNLKIVVIGILYALPPFRRQLRPQQWLGAGLLVIGTTSAEISEAELAGEAQAGGFVGIIMVVGMLTMTAAASVSVEYAYKSTDLPLRLQNVVLYLLGVLFNYIARSIRCIVGLTHCARPFHNFTSSTWLVVVVQAYTGYCISAILKHVDAIAQVTADILAVVFATVFSVTFFGLQLDLAYLGSLFVSFLALLVYYLPLSLILWGPPGRKQRETPSSSSSKVENVGFPPPPPSQHEHRPLLPLGGGRRSRHASDDDYDDDDPDDDDNDQ